MASYNENVLFLLKNIGGTDDADEILGTTEADSIIGHAGDDTIYGGGAIVVVGDGADTIYGNSGHDLIYGNSGNDIIHGDQEDVNSNGDRNDTIYGGLGTDIIHGNTGNDYLAGGGGVAHPDDEADSIIGGLGHDFIIGNGGNDTIIGDDSAGATVGGDDIIYGGIGDDLIYGSKGYDALVGQNGNDTMGGGVGKDTFFIFSNNGADVVLDFEDPDAALYNQEANKDIGENNEWRDDYLVIEKNINGTGIDTFEELQAASSVVDGNLVFDLGEGNSLTLNGVTSIGIEDVLWWDADDTIQNYSLRYYNPTTTDNRYQSDTVQYRTLGYYGFGDGDYMGVIDEPLPAFYVFNEDTDAFRIWPGSDTLFYIQKNIDGTEIDTFEEFIALNASETGTNIVYPESTFGFSIGDVINESQVVFYDQYDYLS